MSNHLNKLHLLVVDSHPSDLAITSNIITNEGHFVDTATTTQEALEKVYETPYDLVLTSLTLRDDSGFNLVKKMRKLDDMRGWMPVMALNCETVPQDIKKCFRVGMSNFILKPLTSEKLEAALSLYTFRTEQFTTSYHKNLSMAQSQRN